jgi:hypothetical protein
MNLRVTKRDVENNDKLDIFTITITREEAENIVKSSASETLLELFSLINKEIHIEKVG